MNPTEPLPNPDPKSPVFPEDMGTSSPALPVPGQVKQPRQVRSETLLHGDRELQIIHGEEIYRLSVTRQGKLILHK